MDNEQHALEPPDEDAFRRLLARAPTPPPMPVDEQAHLRALLDWQRDGAPVPGIPYQAR